MCVVELCPFNLYKGYQNQAFWKSELLCDAVFRVKVFEVF